ncbi:hypothetical protein M752DRAFT_324429 [Aspergillus phoenicis ATCC 13157]|uniref:Uncharacterized protein n=1 Tax=Aspergillus phoenicis ATCC 13157 TaxID=1353007 RepID=A0A370PTI1_ASPPH|nr:hypothetical protein M752DRAFT_324429 [Aspergillus phoenicis ATCC 13157]
MSHKARDFMELKSTPLVLPRGAWCMFNFVEGDVPLPTSRPRNPLALKLSSGSPKDTGNGTPGTVVERSGVIPFEDGDVPCTVRLPEDAQIGEVLRYRFEGCKLTWWDWGVKEDHINTNVDPPDSNGRPEVLIPTSNILQLTVIK